MKFQLNIYKFHLLEDEIKREGYSSLSIITNYLDEAKGKK